MANNLELSLYKTNALLEDMILSFKSLEHFMPVKHFYVKENFMVFPRTVKDRVVQNPKRFQFTQIEPNIYDLTAVPGTITEQGTAINKAYLQPIEQSLYIANTIFNTTGTANVYAVSMSNVVSMADIVGKPFRVKLNANATGATSINVNSIGNVACKKANGVNWNTGKLNGIYTVVYDGVNFILQGEGGDYGTVQEPDVLYGVPFGMEDGVHTGSMPKQRSSNCNPFNSKHTDTKWISQWKWIRCR